MPNPFSQPDAEDAARDRATEAWACVEGSGTHCTVVNLSAFDRALIEAINISDGFDGDHLP
jgi:hypothetical protein